jgi:hypothetical protein
MDKNAWTMISRSIFYICMTIVMGIFLSNCHLQEEVVAQCKTSCHSVGTRMKSVTTSKCECTSYGDSEESVWVLP